MRLFLLKQSAQATHGQLEWRLPTRRLERTRGQSFAHLCEHLLPFLPSAVRLLHLLPQHFDALFALGDGDLSSGGGFYQFCVLMLQAAQS